MFCITIDPGAAGQTLDAFHEPKPHCLHHPLSKASPASQSGRTPSWSPANPNVSKSANALAEGIELDEGSWADIADAATSLKITI